MRRLQRRCARRGVAAVELAILLPLLVFLLIGLWEVGRMVEVQQLLTNAAREGGRQASTGVKSVDQVKGVVVRYLNLNGMPKVTASDVTVENLTSAARKEPSAANQLDRFRVTVTIPFDSVRWVILDQVTDTTTLTGSADWRSMRDIPIEVDYVIPLK